MQLNLLSFVRLNRDTLYIKWNLINKITLFFNENLSFFKRKKNKFSTHRLSLSLRRRICCCNWVWRSSPPPLSHIFLPRSTDWTDIRDLCYCVTSDSQSFPGSLLRQELLRNTQDVCPLLNPTCRRTCWGSHRQFSGPPSEKEITRREFNVAVSSTIIGYLSGILH